MSKKNVNNPAICKSRIEFEVPNEGSFTAQCELPAGHATDEHCGEFTERADLYSTCGECGSHVTKQVVVKATWKEPKK